MKLDRIIRHSAAYLVATGLQRGLPLLVLPVAALFLSTEEIGVVGIGTVVAGAVALVATFGFNVAVVRFVPKELTGSDHRTTSRGQWSSIFVVQLGWALGVGVMALVATSLLEGVVSAVDWGDIVVPAILLGVSGSVLQMALSAHRSREQPGGYLAVAVGVFALSIPLALVGAANAGAGGYLVGLAIGSVIPGLGGIGLAVSKPSFDREFTIKTVGLAGPFMVHWVATWILVGFDRFVIEGSRGLDATGVFYIAFVYASVPLLVAEAFGTAWLPAFINRSTDDHDMVRDTVVVVSLFMTGLVLLGIASAVPILPMLYPDMGFEPVVLLAILAPIAIIRVPHIVASALLIDEHRTTLLGLSSSVAAVVDIVAVVLTIEAFGLAGSAWAKTLAYALASIWVWGSATTGRDRVVGTVVTIGGVLVASTATSLVVWGDGRSVGFVVSLIVFTVGVGFAASGYRRYRALSVSEPVPKK